MARLVVRKFLSTAGAVALAVTVVSCSTESSAAQEQKPASLSGEQQRLSTAPGEALTITPVQLLAATGGLTPVAF